MKSILLNLLHWEFSITEVTETTGERNRNMQRSLIATVYLWEFAMLMKLETQLPSRALTIASLDDETAVGAS